MKNKINKRKKNFWAGRFSEKPSDIMTDLNASINFDKKLYDADIKAITTLKCLQIKLL